MSNEYEKFVTDIEEQYEELWSLAEEKIDLEQQIMTTATTSGGGLIYYVINEDVVGNPVAAKKGDTRAKLLEFAEECCFDYSNIDGIIETIQTTKVNFEIGKAQDDIVEGLYSWDPDKNESAKAFKDNYLYPITDIQADQRILLERSEVALDGVRVIINKNREALKGMISDSKKALNDYNPWNLIMIGEIHATLAVFGLVAKPIAGAISTGVDIIVTENEKALLESSNMNVAELFEALRKATKSLKKAANQVFEDLGTAVDARLEAEKNDDEMYVQRMPSLP